MGTFILNRQKQQIEITDFKEAKQQCKEAIQYLRRTKQFPEALKNWEHIQTEIQKIESKNK